MVAGVILFSVANATIMSIADDLDESGDYNDKVDTLIKLSKETDMKLKYKLRIQQALYFYEKHHNDNLVNLIDSLPHQLKMKFTAFAFEDLYGHLKFFANKSVQFITWVCPLMQIDQVLEDEYFFREGD